MGKGIVEKLANDYDLDVEWVGYELHPETPVEGVLISERFSGMDIEEMVENLRCAGHPYGIEFGEVKMLCNSKTALAAAEFARDKGRFDEFHTLVFEAYYIKGLNIGNLDLILSLAQEAGLDEKELAEALKEGRYDSKLAKATQEARESGVRAIPAYNFDNGAKWIVGAQPYPAFVKALEAIINNEQAGADLQML